MKTIWKYDVGDGLHRGYEENKDDYDRGRLGFVVFDMPAQAQALSVQLQDDRPMLWALVDVSAPLYTRRFVVATTGNPMPDDAERFIGTWQDGGFVFHLFEAT